eukprot:5531997-Pyramimonas_sp.AAC.1
MSDVQVLDAWGLCTSERGGRDDHAVLWLVQVETSRRTAHNEIARCDECFLLCQEATQWQPLWT